jgi:prefoldin subunit 5
MAKQLERMNSELARLDANLADVQAERDALAASISSAQAIHDQLDE